MGEVREPPDWQMKNWGKPDPRTPEKLTAKDMAHAVCENQWGQEGVVKSECDSAARTLLPMLEARDEQIRRQAFEEAADQLMSVIQGVPSWQEALNLVDKWRALTKEKPDE